jgi:hypothetical protein
MNKFLLTAVLTFLYSTFLLSQNSFFIRISDGNYKFKDDKKGNFIVRDYFESTDPSKAGNYKLPGRTFLIAIPPNSTPLISVTESKEEVLSNIIPVMNPEAFLDKDSIISSREKILSVHNVKKVPPLEILGFTWLKNYYCVVVRLNDVSYDEQVRQLILKKGIKLEVKLNTPLNSTIKGSILNEGRGNDKGALIVNYQMAEQFKGNATFGIKDTTGNWFNYGHDYVKIGTFSEGLYRIYKSDLTALGVDVSSIAPNTFQLFESGNEQNIFVSNEQSGVFGDNDYIEFFGTRNFAKNDHRSTNGDNEEFHEYLNRYTDTTIYFLTWGSTNGKRAYTVSGSPSGISDTLKYYTSVNHYEQNISLQYLNDDEVANQTPNWNKNKSWYWNWLGAWGNSNSLLYDTIGTPDVYPDKTARVFSKLVSGASSVQTNSHTLSFFVNGNFLDSEIVNKNDQVVMKGSVSSNNLINGTNQLLLKIYANGTDPNYLALDWYEIEYPRNLNLTGGSLYFEFRDNFGNAVKAVHINVPAAETYEVFKVKPFLKKITNLQQIAGAIVFTDTVNTNDAYVVVNSSGTFKPVYYYKKNFVNMREDKNADYLAISNPLFISAVQNYVSSISSMYSVKPFVANLNDIFDGFSFGYPYPESIKAFVGNAVQNWHQTTLSYLVLFGDAAYDYKRYVQKNTGIVGGGNIVPSYGSPVSDNWYAVFNDSISIPQLKVGRIPFNTASELNYYLSKVQNNFNAPFTQWNKDYLFFSGGKVDLAAEMDQFKAVNESIINNYIKPRPIAGNYTHFYKTVSPFSDYGPYTPEQVKDRISLGGLFISYLGHSGTANWDNSISEVGQLSNDVNRNSLITDFGCSTNKFAEPDIISFGERFVLDGQAIGYIGNTSLGFSSTATSAPLYFYSSIIRDSLYNVGDAHIAGKVKMFNAFGTSNVFKVFALTNTLLGDPVVKIKIPEKPNFVVTTSDIIISAKNINETIDSILVLIAVNNYGTSIQDSLKVEYSHSMNGNTFQSGSYYVKVPDFSDTISVWLKTKNLAGDHTIKVILNGDNRIQEIYTNDNSASFKFNVSSVTLKSLITQKVENPALNSLKFLSPSLSAGFNIAYQVSATDSFTVPVNGNVTAGAFFTKIPLTGLTSGQRYWYKAKIDAAGTNFAEAGSFLNSGTAKYLIADKYAFDNQSGTNTIFYNGKITLLPDTVRISVISGGYVAGSVCVIEKNGINLMTNTLFSGMGIVVFDPVTLNADTAAWFNMFGTPATVQSLADLINSIPVGKIVAMGVCDDAQNSMSGNLITAIQSLGSTLISQIANPSMFRASWALIGKKGAPAGSVIERIQDPSGQAVIHIDSLFSKGDNSGNFITTNIGPASKWNKLIVNDTLPSGTSIKYNLLGIKSDNSIDSLGVASVTDSTASLLFIDAKKYPMIKVKGLLSSVTNGAFPSISSFGVDYSGVPELGTNYQSVSLSADTLLAGRSGVLNFYVNNAGDVRADSVKVRVSVMMTDSAQQILYETVIDTINAESKRLVSVNYIVGAGSADRQFIINIDPDNKINEIYKDNNIFAKPFYVKADSSAGSIKVTFDNKEIMEGDFISSHPVIRIELNDPTLISITDTSSIQLMLNNKQIYIPIDSIKFNSSNPKMVVKYTLSLQDGAYTLLVFGKNAFGTLIDSAGIMKNFQVSNEAKILFCYNYPNPFQKDTYFTFKLTQIPDELHINIFTIAGRLIKKITRTSSELNYDFNRIYWDGRDENGDALANGVYIYKVIISRNGEKQNVTQKLAIIR